MDIDTSPHNRGTLEAMHHQLVLAFSAAEGTGDPAAVSGYTLPGWKYLFCIIKENIGFCSFKIKC